MTLDTTTQLRSALKETRPDPGLLEKLLASKASKVDAYGNSLLFTAIWKENGPELIRALVRGGVDVHGGNSARRTPMHDAVFFMKESAVEALASLGADVNINCTEGMILRANNRTGGNKWSSSSLLQWAIRMQSFSLACLLVRLGANVSSVDSSANTPLLALFHYPSETLSENVVLARQIIIMSANVNAVDGEGRTALHLASGAGIVELVELLIDNGAFINVKDRSGKSPLDYAKDKKMDPCTASLLAHGLN